MKSTLHKRNLHKGQYDFDKLIAKNPALESFVFVNEFGNTTIDFFDSEAVLALNKALLAEHYGIENWNIPEGYLCPPVPGRADYVHHMADILSQNSIPKGAKIKVLDIGTGANCIYPLLGHRIYGWSFVASEIDEVAFQNAKQIIKENKDFEKFIDIRKQENKHLFFQGIIKADEVFEFSMCNPPFYKSAKEAKASNRKKLKSLNPKSTRSKNFNFGGQANELWTEGGEETFIHNMIHESRKFSNNCMWFSTLVSKENILQSVYKAFRKAKVVEYKTVEMSQGNKKSRFVAWTYLDEKQRRIWEEARF